jgi:ElaB/YqjD/DUF883 family membrane-anchored ribosome-binding protein
MALEDTINTKRDVKENQNELNRVRDDLDEVWDDMSAMTKAISEINDIKQRIALLENELKYIARNTNVGAR